MTRLMLANYYHLNNLVIDATFGNFVDLAGVLFFSNNLISGFEILSFLNQSLLCCEFTFFSNQRHESHFFN